MTPTIIFEDDDLLIVNKSPGLLSVSDGYNPSLPHLRNVLEPQFGSLWIVHRLDKETSGLIVLAKNPDAHRALNEQFRTRQIEKKYHGLVTPTPQWREMDINLPLQTDADRRHRTRVNLTQGKDAQSNCRVLKRFLCGALMEIQIKTGITHQIRAHLRSFNLILVGESLYNAGLPHPQIQAERTMLHSRTIAFKHPTSGSWVEYTAPYPEDFRDIYTKLKTTTSPGGAI